MNTAKLILSLALALFVAACRGGSQSALALTDHRTATLDGSSGNLLQANLIQDNRPELGTAPADHLASLAPQISASGLSASTSITLTVYAWAKTWGGNSSSAMAKGVVSDGSGNIYVTGEFSGTVDFDPAGPNPSATVASNMGTVDAFLTKFNSSGVLLWVRTWGGAPAGTPQNGSDGRDAANGVTVDAVGNVYVVGLYQNTVDFGAGIVYTSNAPSGSNNIFVAKFAANGTTLWAHTWGGTTGGEGYSVAVDNVRGFVYVEGDWSSDSHVNSGQVDFNPAGPVHDWHPNHGFYDAFLSKFDLAGVFKWADTWGGHGYDDGPGVAVDSSGNVYVGGMYGSVDINFDPSGATNTGGLGHGHGTPTNDGTDMNVFLSKFDSGGVFQWVRTWGGLGTEDAAGEVIVDGADNVYVGGRFECTDCNFNAGPTGQPALFSSNDDRDAFISKYDSSGKYLWARTWGGSGWDSACGLAVDAANNVFVSGFFVNNVDLTGTGDFHDSKGGRDIFLNQYDSLGTVHWTKTWGGNGDDLGLNVTALGNGTLYVVGSIASQDAIDFDPGGRIDNRTAHGLQDGFLSKFIAQSVDTGVYLPMVKLR